METVESQYFINVRYANAEKKKDSITTLSLSQELSQERTPQKKYLGPSSHTMKTISLLRLTSTCIDAGQRGCEVIRSFHQVHQSSIGGQLKIEGDPRSVVTQCDIDAQATILKGLRDTWGNDLLIIGEEDDNDDESGTPTVGSSNFLRKDILFDAKEVNVPMSPDLDEEIPLDELAIFVDPVDGTREFVEGRLQNVACLIGIARNARPIAGIIGFPFPEGNLSLDSEIHYAVGDQIKIADVWPQKATSDSEESLDDATNEITILTGDSSNPILKKATSCARALAKQSFRHTIVGGTAKKLDMVANSKTPTIAILHFDTQLWDTCSAEALLNCRGGKITDFFGAPLVHSPTRPFGNIFGVVASLGAPDLHDDLCKTLRADGEVVQKIFERWIGGKSGAPVVAQAIDVARDLDGVPYGLEDLQELLKDQNPSNLPLAGYSVPEVDAWRGLMSTGVRFTLDWEGRDKESQSSQPPSDIFYKRIDMAHLSHAQDKLKTAPHKVCETIANMFGVCFPAYSLSLNVYCFSFCVPL